MTSILGSPPRQVGYPGYSGPVGYLVTVCTGDGSPRLGRRDGAGVVLTVEGRIVWEEWQAAERSRPDIVLDAFTVMPSHLRGIVWVVPDRDAPPPGAVLRDFLGRFESGTLQRVSLLPDMGGPGIWGLDHHEWIIRDAALWRDLRHVLEASPLAWDRAPAPR